MSVEDDISESRILRLHEHIAGSFKRSQQLLDDIIWFIIGDAVDTYRPPCSHPIPHLLKPLSCFSLCSSPSSSRPLCQLGPWTYVAMSIFCGLYSSASSMSMRGASTSTCPYLKLLGTQHTHPSYRWPQLYRLHFLHSQHGYGWDGYGRHRRF